MITDWIDNGGKFPEPEKRQPKSKSKRSKSRPKASSKKGSKRRAPVCDDSSDDETVLEQVAKKQKHRIELPESDDSDSDED